MDILATWTNGWSVVGDAENDTYIALAYGEEHEASPNASWDLSDEEDDVERRVIFADLLDRMIEAEVIDTDYISGLVIDISGYDYDRIGNIRGEFILKSEDTGQTYIGNGEDLNEVVTALNKYTYSTGKIESDESEQQGS